MAERGRDPLWVVEAEQLVLLPCDLATASRSCGTCQSLSAWYLRDSNVVVDADAQRRLGKFLLAGWRQCLQAISHRVRDEGVGSGRKNMIGVGIVGCKGCSMGV
jgi:hypothetical protein